YKLVMRFLKATPTLTAPPISRVEIERLCFLETPISASWVLNLLVKHDLKAIAPLVSVATLRSFQCMGERHPGSAAARLKSPVLARGDI
ncbi:[citrate (pro-3S)-lyase] ligase, partial [Salmonella enterica subsp. enterica serovar Oslo]|nr:[citrate (pro-3S)-lyase] ligase [Salmonella enterica subsp. enterica serovar Oslo]